MDEIKNKLVCLDEGNMWCNYCDTWFQVIRNNVPWLSEISHCPFCGGENIEWIEPESDESRKEEGN